LAARVLLLRGNPNVDGNDALHGILSRSVKGQLFLTRYAASQLKLCKNAGKSTQSTRTDDCLQVAKSTFGGYSAAAVHYMATDIYFKGRDVLFAF
jgi:hypothetical protein